MHSRRRSRMLIGILAATLAVAEPGAASFADVEVPQTEQTEPEAVAPAADSGPPNLLIQIEGNRRWCVRTVEAIWPAEPAAPPPRRAGRRRGPSFTTMAYAYYFVAGPAREAPADGGGPAATAAPGAEDGGEGPPEPAAADAEAAEQEGPTAAEMADLETAFSPVDADLANRPESIVLDQSPVIRTVSQRRVQPRGKPMELKPFWDLSRSCTSVPSHVNATLPPGRYEVQINFDVLMAQHGWRHVQLARVDGVEVTEGSPTVLTLRVNTEGYVEARPVQREVRFLTPDAGADMAEAEEEAPAAAAPAP